MNRAFLFHRIFAQRKIKWISLFISVLVGAYSSLFPQATIPILNLPTYDSQMLSEVYGQSYFLNSISAWTDTVNYYQGLIRVSWENAADTAILDYVDTITMSDAYNDVNAYKDYVDLELRSQAEAQWNEWEHQANLDLLANRNEFVARLNTNRINESYLERLVIQSGFGSNLNSSLGQDPNAIAASNISNSISSARSSWENHMYGLYDQGNAEFSNATAEMETRYNDTLAALDASDAEFRKNLDAIDVYKKKVETAISSMLTGFETDLAQACTTSDHCAYRYGNNGGYNDAGDLLNNYITDIRAALNLPATTTSFSLTNLAISINDFLSNQTILANDQQTSYSRRINTYQRSLNNILVTDARSIQNSSLADEQYFVRNLDYDGAKAANGESEWTSNPANEFGNTTNETMNVVSAILHAPGGNQQANMNAYVNGKLSGTGRSLVGNVSYNLLTKDYGMANKAAAGDWLSWVSISKGSFDCGWGCGDPSPAFRGNMLVDTASGVDFSKYRLNRPGFYNDYRMDHITYSISYEIKDDTMQSYTNYWSGVKSSLINQFGMYSMQITPAISSWETQVKQYKEFYNTWKVQADLARVQAKVDFDNSLADLDTKRQTWLSKIQDEYQSGFSNWQDLSVKANVATSQRELSILQSNANAILSGVNQLNTGASEVLTNYSDSLSALSSRNFSVTETNTLSSYSYVNGLNSQLSPLVRGGGLLSLDYGMNSILKNADYGLEIASVTKISGIAVQLGSLTRPKLSTTTSTFSLFGAASEKTINTSLKVNGKDISAIFQTTTNGVYQYSQLLSMNENNDLAALAEQEKMLNQQAYGIRWDSRSVARFDDKGELQGDSRFRDILKDLTNNKKYESVIAACNAANDASRNCFNEAHASALQRLKEIDPALEFQEGMIVRSLTAAENFRLGILDPNTKLKSSGALTEEQREEMKKFGSCYVNPESCSDLLRKDFNVVFNKETKVVTLSKEINNGRVEGRNARGEYISGKEMQSRTLTLASVQPVIAPKGKDLFDVWGKEDWNDVSSQANAVMSNFYSTSLTSDNKTVASATRDINTIENANERRFQKEKQDLEARDSLIKDLIIAYISGGMAGVKGAIKNKVEDQINTGLAEAWARASGADEEQIGMLTQAISFMRGKVAEKKIKSQQATNNLQNAGTAMVATAAAFGKSFASFGTGMVALRSGNFAAAGASFANGVQSLGTGFTAMGNAVTALTATSQGMVATGLFLAGGNTIATGTTVGAYREIAGDEAADRLNRQITGPQTRLAEIRAERVSMLQSNVTQAVAKSTGLPAEVIGNMITDYKGAKEAKAVRKAVDSNPVAGVVSRIASATLGVYKTAVVAMGVPDRKIARALSEGNAIAFSGITDKRLQQSNLAFASQALGMQAPGTSYTSATPTLKDKEGLVKELGQRMIVDQLSAGMTENEKAVINAAIRGQVSKTDQKKADKKAQTAAIRSTAITAATMGAGAAAKGAQGTFAAFLKTYISSNAELAPKIFGALVGMGVQTVDGSRNRKEGMLAGFANGAIGVATAGGGLKLSGLKNPVMAGLNGSTLGLGVTYDRQAGWGGMIGVGGDRTNASISFSQRGNTTVNGSAQTHIEGVQLTASSTTNGSTTVGLAYNPSNEGPRRGQNYSINYDTDNGQVSGSAGYTNPDYGIGFTANLDANGVSLSTQNNGINVATVSADGFQYDEFNWAEQNINVAQDMTGDAERAQKAREFLIERGGDPDLVRNLSDDDAQALEVSLRNVNDSATSPDATAGAAAGVTGLALVGALVLGRRREGDGVKTPTPTPIPNDLPKPTKVPVPTPLPSDLPKAQKTHEELKNGEVQITKDGIKYNINGFQKTLTDSGDIATFKSLGKAERQKFLELKTKVSLAERGMMVADVDGKMSVDPAKKEAYERYLKEFSKFIEPTYKRMTTEKGDLVFTKEQVEQFKMQTSFVLNGKLFIRETGSDYFSTESLMKDGLKQRIKITDEGKIKEVLTKQGIQKTSTFDLNGKRIQPIVAVDDPVFIDSNRRFTASIGSVKEYPSVQDFKSNPSKKGSLTITETAADGTTKPAGLATVEKIGRQLIQDVVYDYDTSADPRKKLKQVYDKFTADNGLDAKGLTPEQSEVKTHLDKMYEELASKYITGTKDKKPFQLEGDKRKYMDDRRSYIRENHQRLTTELLVSRYKDKIDLENSSEKVTVLKDGAGVILNQVLYDSQNDNETIIKFDNPKYTLRPGNECSPTSVAMVMEYLGAVGMHDKVQLVDDIIAEGIKSGIVKKGEELKDPKQIEKLITNYGLTQKEIKPDNLLNHSRAENIKAQIIAGKPVVTHGNFGIDLGFKDSNGDQVIVKGHVITIVGYDETGWIIHDPFGDANSDYKNRSGKYVHYDFGKWNIGNSSTYTMSIPEATK